MSKTATYTASVEFLDCDPAAIAFFPNFSRWLGSVSRGRSFASTTYGETIEVRTIHTTVEQWAANTFRHRHKIMRGDELLCEGTEVRAFVIRDLANSERIKAIPIPENIRALCS